VLTHIPAVITMHYNNAEMSLYEVGVSKTLITSDTDGPDFKRQNLLSACLQASKSCLETFLSLPMANYFALSMNCWTDMTYALIILHMLSVYDHKDWNLKYVQETFDFSKVIGMVIKRFDEIHLQTGFQSHDMFSLCARKLHFIKAYMDEKISQTAINHEGRFEILFLGHSISRNIIVSVHSNTGYQAPSLWEVLVQWY